MNECINVCMPSEKVVSEYSGVRGTEAPIARAEHVVLKHWSSNIETWRLTPPFEPSVNTCFLPTKHPSVLKSKFRFD